MCCYEDFFLTKFFYLKVCFMFHIIFLKNNPCFSFINNRRSITTTPTSKNNNHSSISPLNHVGLESILILTQILWNILLLVVGIKKKIFICILLWKHYWCHTFVCNYALLRKMPYSRQNSYSNKHKGRLTVFKMTFITKNVHIYIYQYMIY